MSNLKSYAEIELEILEKSTTGDAVIVPFKKELIALADAFGKSGQSGGSAPFVATALSQAVKKLLLFEPITEITGIDEEWSDRCIDSFSKTLQNKRCSALFKNITGECHYVDAIVFKGEEKHSTFTSGGSVYVDRTFKERIGSSQIIKGFPFTPKTFYLDVEYVPIRKEAAEELDMYYIENRDGSCYMNVLKDPKQLEEVRKYYQVKTK